MVIGFYQLRERESTNNENQGMELLDCTILIEVYYREFQETFKPEPHEILNRSVSSR